MAHDSAPPDARRPLIGGRYRLDGLLGAGGMAEVYQAVDVTSGKRIALKQMRGHAREDRRPHAMELFEREYLTLAQLSHPRVVEVYDYGLDARGPYYTMELLDGGDLQHLSPLPFRRAAALMRDVCSALSLLHSRRFVYRDLSPRNVRCTHEGPAKLIDFGAMTAMGATRELVGTPPCVPHEALAGRPLDARSDLYALGATLYYALTRRHAYPAHRFEQLWELWQKPARPPSAFAAEIPEELDALVLELLAEDPAQRPRSAAEVMERLSAIAGLPPDDPGVHQAYLAAPSLVGRESELNVLRDSTLLIPDQPGSSVLVRGPEGSGRSRLLEACALEAKLSGMLVLKPPSARAPGAYGAIRELTAQLFEAARAVASEAVTPHRETLSTVLPALSTGERAGAVGPIPDGERVGFALTEFLSAVALHQPLLIVVDDLAQLDATSAACLAQLVSCAPLSPVALVFSATCADLAAAENETPLKQIASLSRSVVLEPLSLAETKQLLGSIFGDVPNLHELASYVDRVASGCPRDIMRLAQHLVHEKYIRYASGAWSVPERLVLAELPRSMADARKLQLAKLTPRARALGYALCAEPKLSFSLDECLSLDAAEAPAETLARLRELLAAEVLLREGPRYRTARLGLFPLLSELLPETELRAAEWRLARVFAQREDGVRAALHAFEAGEEREGLRMLVDDAVRSEARTNADWQAFFDLLRGLPRNWMQVYDHALSLCETAHAARERDALLSRLNGLVSHAVRDTNGFVYLERRLAQLERDAGLDLYAAQPTSLPEAVRLARALELAQLRYAETPPSERVREPRAAIAPLAATLLAAVGTLAFTHDVAAFSRLPSLTPLVALAPSLRVVDQIARGLGERLMGRNERAMTLYRELIERMAQPDRGGLPRSSHVVTELRITLSLGALEAALGQDACLARIAHVQAEPEYETQALMLRQLYHLWQGEEECAARAQQALELRKGDNAHHGFEGQHLVSALSAYALCDALTQVKQATDTAEAHARVHAGWLPIAHYGRGEYHRIRGDRQAALREHHEALRLSGDAAHPIWAYAAGSELRLWVELRLYDQALVRGAELAQIAARGELGYLRHYLSMPLAVALSRTGEVDEATALADAVIADFGALSMRGLNMSLAYETRAYVALASDDRQGFVRWAALASEYSAGKSRRLDAAYAAWRKHRPESARVLELETKGAIAGTGVRASVGHVAEDATDVSLHLASDDHPFTSVSLAPLLEHEDHGAEKSGCDFEVESRIRTAESPLD